jgi:hypothetical protein
MNNLIIFFVYFYLLLVSVIGFGFFFQRICFVGNYKFYDEKIIYTGFYGLFFLTLISLVTSFFVPHNFIHNIFIHFFGISYFFFFKFENKKNYLKTIFIISLFTISALLISKTHDDFSYYHLPFTRYLTEHKVIFGMGNLLHGYKLLSSLFFLNSTFYLPLIEYYSFHFTSLFFLIFFNFFLFKEINSQNNHDFFKYLYIFALIFFNLSFNRLAEYGTDKAGQLLIVILTIKILQFIYLEKNKNNLKNIMLLIPLFAFCMTLKTYFLPYILIGILIIFFNDSILKTLKFVFFSKLFFIFFLTLLVYFTHHFISTGCIISPVSSTCFGNNLDWAQSKSHYHNLSIHLETWAKAGKGPNFEVKDYLEYIQYFNWVPQWLRYYFIGKVTDQFLILTLTFLITFFLFKNLKLKKTNLVLNLKFLFFYGIVLIIFSIWFTNHPQLRYGGYAVCFLVLTIPIAIVLDKFENKILFQRKFKYLIIIIVIFFNIKNFTRINGEFQRNDYYKFNNFPFFAILEKNYIPQKTESGLIVYKTQGHCWNTPSPCVPSFGKLSLKTKKINKYYFFYR